MFFQEVGWRIPFFVSIGLKFELGLNCELLSGQLELHTKQKGPGVTSGASLVSVSRMIFGEADGFKREYEV
ncbi:hypothetical protein THF1C08_180039 [Vibrio jasicida]|uniref:Uncharacterized protein n=1 Tax=Vibrio jasicida TaxID=766224 RepID=A0AAU9QIA3_9VIBR|nr:hypothetical protein THF1C08_180039 [Vibrio jasicida]CAH1581352.1 hypothetical protein THF1A12_170040 [Vibrio jasicida]